MYKILLALVAITLIPTQSFARGSSAHSGGKAHFPSIHMAKNKIEPGSNKSVHGDTYTNHATMRHYFEHTYGFR